MQQIEELDEDFICQPMSYLNIN